MSEAIILPIPKEEGPGGALLFNVNLILASNVTINAVSFFIVVVIARSLGPEGRGVTSLYQTAVSFGYALVSLGVGIGVLYYVSKSQVTPRQALEAGLSITLVGAIVVAAVVGLLALFLNDRLRGAGVPYWLLVIAIPLVVQFRVVESVLRSRGRFLVVSILETLAPFTTLAGLVTLEAAGSLTIGRALAVWTLAAIIPVLAGYAFVPRADWPHRASRPDVLGKLLRFGMAGQAGNIVQFLNYRLDAYLVLLFVDARGVGLYAIGVSLSEALWLLANSVAVVLVPRLTAADDEYVAHMTPLVCRGTLLASAAGAGALALLCPWLVPLLFGEAFKGSVAPLLWLLPGTVALSASKVLSAYVFSKGRPIINTAIAITTFAVTMVGDVALIPTLDIKGAAIASSLAYGVSLTATAGAYVRLSGRSITEALLPRWSDLAIYVESVRAVVARLRPPARLQNHT